MQLNRFSIPLTFFLLAQFSVYGNENVKTFATQQCRYTLPSNKWKWVDHTGMPNAVCAAEHEDGRIVVLCLTAVPRESVVDEAFVKGVDREAASEATMKKRGGRITTFKNSPCYECEHLIDGAMVASRIILANGFHYHVWIRGDLQPVEKLPDYESIMNGFEFTSPPVPHAAGPDDPFRKGKEISSQVGKSLAYMIPLGLVAIFWLAGRKKK